MIGEWTDGRGMIEMPLLTKCWDSTAADSGKKAATGQVTISYQLALLYVRTCERLFESYTTYIQIYEKTTVNIHMWCHRLHVSLRISTSPESNGMLNSGFTFLKTSFCFIFTTLDSRARRECLMSAALPLKQQFNELCASYIRTSPWTLAWIWIFSFRENRKTSMRGWDCALFLLPSPRPISHVLKFPNPVDLAHSHSGWILIINTHQLLHLKLHVYRDLIFFSSSLPCCFSFSKKKDGKRDVKTEESDTTRPERVDRGAQLADVAERKKNCWLSFCFSWCWKLGERTRWWTWGDRCCARWCWMFWWGFLYGVVSLCALHKQLFWEIRWRHGFGGNWNVVLIRTWAGTGRWIGWLHLVIQLIGCDVGLICLDGSLSCGWKSQKIAHFVVVDLKNLNLHELREISVEIYVHLSVQWSITRLTKVFSCNCSLLTGLSLDFIKFHRIPIADRSTTTFHTGVVSLKA